MTNEIKRNYPFLLDLQMFAEYDDDKPDDKPADDDAPDKRTVTMTQAELDALISREKGRVKSKFADYDELKAERDRLKAEEDARQRAAMTEAERLKAEKEEAAKKAEQAAEEAAKVKTAANQRIINTEIRAVARALNANDAGDVLSFVDKAQIAIDEDGNVTGVEEAVAALKASKPYLFKAPIGADAAGGSDPHRNPNKSELAALEKEYAETKAAAIKDRRLMRKVNELYHKIEDLKSKR